MSSRRCLHGLALVGLLVAILALSFHLRVDLTRRLGPELAPYVADEQGDLYLYARDAFLYFRQSKNLLDHGHAGERLKNGRPWDAFSFAPQGRLPPPSLLAVLQATVYRALPGAISLQATAFYLPAVVSTLLLIPLFLLGKDLGGIRCGLAAAFLAAMHPEIVSHCHAGIADTTPLNLLFFVTGTWIFLRGLDALAEKRWWRAGLSALLLILVMALFRLTWTAWPMLPALVVGVLALHLGPRIFALASTPSRKLLTAAGGAAVAGLSLFAASRSGLGLKLLRYSQPDPQELFPSGLEQVQELAPLSAGQLVDHLGGALLVALGLVGIALGQRRRGSGMGTITLLAWLLPAAVAGYFSMRFAVYAVPPLALLAGRGISAGSDELRARFGPRARIPAALLVASLLATLAWGYHQEIQTFSSRRPAVDKAVAEVAQVIRETAAPEAQIHTAWDFGYIYAALAQRAVTLDGGSLGRQRLYWFDRALSTADETEALTLLRWIGCGVEVEAFELLTRYAHRAAAARILQGAARQPRPGALRAYLDGEGLPPDLAEAVIETLDCRPPEAWVVLSSDLLGKAHAWFRYGSRDLASDELGPAQPQVTAEVACEAQPRGFACGDGSSVDLEADGWTDLSSPGHIAARGPAQADGWVAIVYQVRQSLALLYVRQDLADSLFARLYFFHGRGLAHFQLIHDARYPPFTRRVLAYRVDR